MKRNLKKKLKPYFNENLKLNQRYQMKSEKDDDDNCDDNLPPQEPPPINFETEKVITRKNMVEFRNQLTMQKDNHAYGSKFVKCTRLKTFCLRFP